MNQTKLYINEKQLELKKGTIIAPTFQIFDLAELKNYQLNYTNRIKVPKTKENKVALGYAEEINSTERNPYKVHDARIITGGVEIIPDGTAIIEDIGNDYTIVVYSGLFDLFETLSSLSLHDLPTLEDHDHDWDLTTASGSYSNTSGYIYPAIQYGTVATNDTNLDVRYSFPSFFIHTLVSDIISQQGFTKSGSILSDSFYQSWALPFSKSKWDHSDRYVSERSFSNQLGQTEQIYDVWSATVTNRVAKILPLEPKQTFTSPGSSTITCTVTCTVTDFSESQILSDTITQKLVILKNSATTPVVLNSVPITGDGPFLVTSSSISLVSGDTLEAAIVADYTVTSGFPNTYSMKITSCSMYSDPIERAISFGDEVTPEAYLPKISQKDFLKSIGQMLGVIFVVDPSAKTIEFKQIDDIKNNIYKARDWSDKLVKPDTPDPNQWYVRKKTVLSSQYGQKSYLRYKSDDTVPDELGDSYLTVDDEVLDKEKTLIGLPWAASDSSVLMTHSTYMARIPFWQDDGVVSWEEVSDKPKQRFVYIDRADETVTYTDGTSTSAKGTGVPFAKFIDPANAENLDFVSLRNKSYSGLQTILTDAVKLDVLLYLKATDVVDFDHFIPVYFDRFDSYFYVNRIVNFIEGKVTKVELVKIG